MISEVSLRACLRREWGLADATTEVHDGGMNSATWFVSEGPARWVAKAVVPASRRSFAGGLVDAYLAHGTMPSAEVDHGLATMLTFRWAVQADYFARRIAAADLTGIASTADNERGLEHARRGLSGATDRRSPRASR